MNQLQKKANEALLVAQKAQAEADQAVKELENAQRKKKQKEQDEQYARDAKEVVDNTRLPKWAMLFIRAEAYDRGHSAGESEVNMLTVGMIHEAEVYYRKYAE